MRFYCSPGGRFLFQSDDVLRYGESPVLCETVSLLYSGHSESEIREKLGPKFPDEEIAKTLLTLESCRHRFKKKILNLI